LVRGEGREWRRLRAFLGTANDSYASAAPKAADPEPKATLTGPQIWRWDDDDWRDEHWRRLEFHNRMKRH
jgi:hypothetical protein